MKSSLNFFFGTALILLVLGFISESTWSSLANHVVALNNVPNLSSRPYDLASADYHLSMGEVEVAIDEYKAIAENYQPPVQTIATSQLSQIFSRQQTLPGRLSYVATQILWKIHPILYGLGGFLLLCWAGLWLYRSATKKPSFAILPLKNCTELGGIDELSTLVLEYIQDIRWKTQNTSGMINRLISEQLEIPTIGPASEVQSTNIEKLLESAWAITSGHSNLSVTELLKSLRLWLNPPRFLINGSLVEAHESLQLRLFMYNGNTGQLEKTWQVHIPATERASIVSILVEDITFLLIHFFNQHVTTRNWRALQASLNGNLHFALYVTDRQVMWLESARKSLEAALALDPDYDVARYNLGLVCMAMGQFDSARTLLKPMTLK